MKGWVIAGMVVSATAGATLPPTSFILSTVAQKRGSMQAVQVRGRVSLAAAPNDPITLRWVFSPKDNRLIGAFARSTDAGERDLFAEDRRAGSLGPAASALLVNQPKILIDTVRSAGVSLEKENETWESELRATLEDGSPHTIRKEPSGFKRLGRFRDQVAWILGAPGAGSPQLWIEKDSFFPLKFAFGKNEVKGVAEVVFMSHRFTQDFAFPRAIEGLDRNGARVYRVDITDVTVVPEAKAGIKMPKLPGVQDLTLAAAGWTSEGSSLSSSTKEALEALVASLW